MKKNHYFYAMYRRRNVIKETLYDFFYGLSSGPRLVLEVFLRKNMGERYFSPFVAIIILLLLLVGPFIIDGHIPFKEVLWLNITWYLFTAAFVYFSFKRWQEVRHLPSVFELKRFSLSHGQAIPALNDFAHGNGLVVSAVAEPGVAFALGAVLLLADQKIGGLLVVCSFIYAMSYVAAYYKGRNYVMDKMDELICNEVLYASFVEMQGPRDTKGFEFVGDRPKDRETREKVVETFWDEDDDEAFEVR